MNEDSRLPTEDSPLFPDGEAAALAPKKGVAFLRAHALRLLLSLLVLLALAYLAFSYRHLVAQALASLLTADKGWLLLAALCSVCIWVAGTASQLGSTTVSPPLGRLFAVQVAASFVNQVVPASVGGATVNVRFLERSGASRSSAIASTALNSLVTAVTHVLLVLLTLILVPSAFSAIPGTPSLARVNTSLHSVTLTIRHHWPLLLLAVLLLASFLVWRRVRMSGQERPSFSARLAEQLLSVRQTLRAVTRSPRRVALLWLASFASPLLHALIAYSILQALEDSLPFFLVIFVYLVTSALSTILPSPGGVGALDVTLTAGLVAAGAPTATAIATVLGYRFFTVWLPLLPGAVVFTELLRRRVI